MRSLQNAIIRLLRDYPFYGQLLLGCRRRAGNGPEPAGITISGGLPTIVCHEGSFRLLSPPVQEGLLRHLIRHLIHLHMLRRKERNRHDWDVACDLAVNADLPFLPEGAIRPGDFEMRPWLAAEEYYDLIVPPFDIGNAAGSGHGNASKEEDGKTGGEGNTTDLIRRCGTVDSHREWGDADAVPVPLAQEMVRGMVREALKAAGGEVPDDARRAVEMLLAPPALPWRQILRQFVATAGRIGRRSTWMRSHRRFGHETPGTRKRRRLNLLVAIDVSDSTDREPLRNGFAAELLRIARGRDAAITVLYSGSRVRKIETFRGDPGVVESFRGGGFTDLRPVFDYARGMVPPPAAVIYLTDGFGPAPERMEFPTLWVLTAEGKKPTEWGVELRLDREETDGKL